METDRIDGSAMTGMDDESSRTTLLLRFGALGLGGLLALTGIGGSDEADAKKKGKGKKRGKKGRGRRCRLGAAGICVLQ